VAQGQGWAALVGVVALAGEEAAGAGLRVEAFAVWAEAIWVEVKVNAKRRAQRIERNETSLGWNGASVLPDVDVRRENWWWSDGLRISLGRRGQSAAHLSAHGCEDEAGLGEDVEQEVRGDAGGKTAAADYVDDGERCSEDAGGDDGSEAGLPTSAEEGPDAMGKAEEEAGEKDLQDDSEAAALQRVHEIGAEDDLLETARNDGESDGQEFEAGGANELRADRRESAAKCDVGDGDDECGGVACGTRGMAAGEESQVDEEVTESAGEIEG